MIQASHENQSQSWQNNLSAAVARTMWSLPGKGLGEGRQHGSSPVTDGLLGPDGVICSRDPVCLELELSLHLGCTSQ